MSVMIDTNELAEMLGVSKRNASKLIREVMEEMKAQGLYVISTKPLRAPREKVMKKIGVKL
jgi:phage anti-repressor protein